MPWNKAAQETYKRSRGRFETDLTDREWALVEPLIPPPSRMGRQRGTNLREVFNAIRLMLGTGCQWLCHSEVFSAVCDGSELFLRLAGRRCF